MPLQLTIHHGPPHLLIEVSGPAQLSDLRGVAAFAAAACAATPYRRCLVDLREMDIEMSFTERMRLGTFVGESLLGLEKVATVVSPVVRQGISERVAQKVGARLRSFTDIDEATAWITTASQAACTAPGRFSTSVRMS